MIKNENGMSLVSVLMAAAMTAGIALVIAQLGKNSSTIVKDTTQSNDINAIYNRIEKYMLHADSCEATITQFNNLPLNTPVAFNRSQAIMTNYKDVNGNNNEVSQISIIDSSGNKTRIGSVEINNIEFERVSSDEVELILSLDKNLKAGASNERIIKKRIRLQAKFSTTSTNRPLGCFSQLDNAIVTTCQKVGGEIDSSGNCKLTDETVGEIVENGMNENYERVEMFLVDGNMTTNQPVKYTRECRVSNKRCSRTSSTTCTPSCRSGFKAGSPSGNRYSKQQSAFNKECMRKYWCEPNSAIGFLLKEK